MARKTYLQALNDAMRQEMERDPNVFILGEDVGKFGGCFGVTQGLYDQFGERRVRDTPISESAIMGAAAGAAAAGLRPIAELMFVDFIGVAMDQLFNQAAKMRFMFGGKAKVPMVLRMPQGAGVGAAAQHSQSLEAWLTHVPGLKVVYPSCAEDALGLMLSAILSDTLAFRSPTCTAVDKAAAEELARIAEVDIEDLIPEETSVITRTHFGYFKRQAMDAYRSQRRGGRGI